VFLRYAMTLVRRGDTGQSREQKLEDVTPQKAPGVLKVRPPNVCWCLLVAQLLKNWSSIFLESCMSMMIGNTKIARTSGKWLVLVRRLL
jgi:hypothetical protein